LPSARPRFVSLVAALARDPMSPFVLAELHDLLESLARADFEGAVEVLPRARLDALSANQLAAMVETRAARLGIFPPQWTYDIEPLDEELRRADVIGELYVVGGAAAEPESHDGSARVPTRDEVPRLSPWR
jgi:hypothetical protein